MSAIDLEALRSSIADVLSAECASRQVHSFIDDASPLDEALWRNGAELGWMAVGLPEEVGGLGLGAAGLDVLHAELGRRVAPGPFIATLSAAQWLAEVGGAEVTGYLEQVAAGALKIAVPASFDAADPLALNGDRLTGQSPLLLGSASSGLVMLPVATPQGAAWALVEPSAEATLSSQPMWDLTREVSLLRCEGAAVAALIYDSDGKAGQTLQRHLCLAIAADSLGAAYAIAEQTIEYLKTRVQFGRPIGSFQALKHRVADQMVMLATNRHLVAQAVETAGDASGDMWAALAKASVSDAFRFVAADCLQLHGGIGYTWEYDCHLYLKRARLNEMLAGANPRLRDFAAAELARITLAGGTAAELAA